MIVSTVSKHPAHQGGEKMEETPEQTKRRKALAKRISDDPEYGWEVLRRISTVPLTLADYGLSTSAVEFLARHGVRTNRDLRQYSITEIIAMDPGRLGYLVCEEIWKASSLSRYMRKSGRRKDGDKVKEPDLPYNACAKLWSIGVNHYDEAEVLTAGNLLAVPFFNEPELEQLREVMAHLGLYLKGERPDDEQ